MDAWLLVITGRPSSFSSSVIRPSVRKLEQLINKASVFVRMTSYARVLITGAEMLPCACVPSPAMASTSKPASSR